MEKEPVLDQQPNTTEDPNFRPWDMDLNSFCMLMHFSQFAGFVVPFAGLALPIVMWATNKDKSVVIDAHGKNIINWMISSIIYFIIGFIAFFVVVGVFLLIALGICSLIFTIIGAVKASNGEIYKYPLSFTFLK